MKNYISFFSSNSRELYVKNIYQCLALPMNHVIQYRYDKQYISDEIINNIEGSIGKKGIIFYYYRYDQIGVYKGIKTEGNRPKAIPIREVTIVDIKEANAINQFNFFLELGEFITTEDYKYLNSDEKEIGESKFVKSLKFKNVVKVKWIQKIEEVKDYFQGIHFFNINKIYTENINYASKFNYHPIENKSSLNLYADASYIFEFLSYDNSNGKSALEIITDKSYIKVNDELETGARVNSKSLVFLTRPIDYQKDSTFIDIKDEKSDFKINIPVNLKKKLRSSIGFGIVSGIIFVGLPLSNLYISGKLNSKALLVMGAIAIVAGTLTGILHRHFNKK